MFSGSGITHNGLYRPPGWYLTHAPDNDTLRINTLKEISTPTSIHITVRRQTGRTFTFGEPMDRISIILWLRVITSDLVSLIHKVLIKCHIGLQTLHLIHISVALI